MNARFQIFAVILVAGCDAGFSTTKGEKLESEVDDLQTRVQALEAEKQTLTTQLETLSTQLETAQTTLAAVEELLEIVGVNADGDVVIDNANLWVQNGTGNTAGEVNGKGNIYVGYNEQGRCSGGVNAGAPCGDGLSFCNGGTCHPGDGMETTGSHNLIVGSWIEHSSYAGLGVGESNILDASQCTTVGAGNACAAERAFVAGRANTASGSSCSVLGGAGGTCSANESVVLGGFANEATVEHSIVP